LNSICAHQLWRKTSGKTDAPLSHCQNHFTYRYIKDFKNQIRFGLHRHANEARTKVECSHYRRIFTPIASKSQLKRNFAKEKSLGKNCRFGQRRIA